MSFDPTPHLLFPSCADCNRIGLPPMPEMLRNMERDVGAAAVREFILSYGGREFFARSAHSESRADESPAEAWMRKHYSRERITVPKGPAANSARLAWTIFTRLAEGWSHNRIAAATACHLRTVTIRKNLFLALGVLPAPEPTSPHQETSPC